LRSVTKPGTDLQQTAMFINTHFRSLVQTFKSFKPFKSVQTF
jgi:hypothetical protein